jgi:hypothetical protein
MFKDRMASVPRGFSPLRYFFPRNAPALQQLK